MFVFQRWLHHLKFWLEIQDCHCEISTSYECVIPSKLLLYTFLYLMIYHLRFICYNLKRCILFQYVLEIHSLYCWEDNSLTSLGTQLWYFCTVHCTKETDNWLLSKERKKKTFHKHSLKAHCKNQRCSVRSGWSQGGLCLLSLLFYCPGHPIDAGPNHKKGKNRVVSSMPKRLRQLSFFLGLYLMPLLGCSKCTKTSGCLWSRVAGAAALKKLNKWQQRRKKVTLSPHSTAVPQLRHAIFLTLYISLVIFRWLI